MKKTLIAMSALLPASLLLTSGAALAAGHGRPGLWNVTTTATMTNMPQMPPQVMAMMKQRGMKMPGMGEPIASQMCMTQEEINANNLPRGLNRHGESCETHIIRNTASSVAANSVCTGQMKGKGHVEVVWIGNEHYSGSYNFKSAMEGHANEINSTFKADWVKSDCGSVKPVSELVKEFKAKQK